MPLVLPEFHSQIWPVAGSGHLAGGGPNVICSHAEGAKCACATPTEPFWGIKQRLLPLFSQPFRTNVYWNLGDGRGDACLHYAALLLLL